MIEAPNKRFLFLSGTNAHSPSRHVRCSNFSDGRRMCPETESNSIRRKMSHTLGPSPLFYAQVTFLYPSGIQCHVVAPAQCNHWHSALLLTWFHVYLAIHSSPSAMAENILGIDRSPNGSLLSTYTSPFHSVLTMASGPEETCGLT